MAALEDGDNELTMLTREVMNELREELVRLDERIRAFEQCIKQAFRRDDAVGGVGEISATAVVAAKSGCWGSANAGWVLTPVIDPCGSGGVASCGW